MADSSKIRAIQKQKLDFIQRQVETANQFEEVLTDASSSLLVWLDRNYETEITDEDLANFWFNADQLQAFVELLQQLVNLSQGSPVTQGAYQTVNNQIKDIK